MAAETNETAQERQKRIKQVYYNKKRAEKITLPFEEFYAWYEQQEQKCCYCGITEAEIARLIASGKLINKRLPQRGRRLELDRKNSSKGYNDFDNLALACYWCNNAKTDTFTHEEFKKIGQGFKQIWQDRLKEL
ncbi:MAG: hypothetical protein LBD18_03240 [Treponema sp.]|nr:hypothetical protein [Treponema sp.]